MFVCSVLPCEIMRAVMLECKMSINHLSTTKYNGYQFLQNRRKAIYSLFENNYTIWLTRINRNGKYLTKIALESNSYLNATK